MKIRDVQGYCPACGERTLHLTSGGFIKCLNHDCTRRDAASLLLMDSEVEHLVDLTDEGFTVKHPLRERVEGDLFDCDIFAHVQADINNDWVSKGPGRYRVVFVGHDPVSSSLHAQMCLWERL